MPSIEDYRQIARCYLKEACKVLEIEDGVIRMRFASNLPTVHGITQFSIYNHKEQTIIVNEKWLYGLINKNGVTPLRSDIYCKARFAYQQIYLEYINPNYEDGLAFSLALMAVKGVQLPLPPMVTFENYFNGMLNILKKEFGMECELQLTPDSHSSEIRYYYLRLKDTEEVKHIHKMVLEPHSSVKIIDSSHKGTKEDPFDNLDDAVEYINELEREAYENDMELKRTALSNYFYDYNFHQFRYPFACPYIAFYKNDFPEDCFIVNQSMNPDGYFDFTLKPNLYGRKFLYRGQYEDFAPKPCVPNLFRNPNKTYFLDDLIWSQEMELLLMTHPLVRLMYDGVELIHDHFRFNINLGGLTQHYYHKTSFLDLTSSIDVAKFFAVTNYCNRNDTYYPVAPDDKLGVIYCYELQMPSPFQRHKNGYHLSVIGKQVFMRSGAQHGFLLDMPRGLDMKCLPEVRAIYFRHNIDISNKVFKRADNGRKYFAMDLFEKVWKEEYSQKKDNGIVSADTVKLNVSRNMGESFDSISKKLLDAGITIDSSYVPHFPVELLNEYYVDIKNGWWDEFCKDIFFYGADGSIYKDAMRNLPNDYRYSKYFKKNNHN